MQNKKYFGLLMLVIKLHAQSLQSCPTTWDFLGYSLSGSSVMGFSRQNYWSSLPCLPPGALPWSRDQTLISCISCIAVRFFYHWATREALVITLNINQLNYLLKTRLADWLGKAHKSKYMLFKSNTWKNVWK